MDHVCIIGIQYKTLLFDIIEYSIYVVHLQREMESPKGM